jgi:hypothetical protein
LFFAHTRDYQPADFFTAKGPGEFDADETPEWRVTLRLNYLHDRVNPDDNVAFQEVCDEFNTPRVGSPMDPHGVVACVFAHALKWPPAVRHFQSTLRNLIKTRAAGAKTFVDAFYETVSWADGQPFGEMHAVLSVAGRAHALTGLAVSAGQLGLTCTRRPTTGEYKVISLGVAGKQYYLRPRAELDHTVSLLETYIQMARDAGLIWPDEKQMFQVYADGVLRLMATCHSADRHGLGLTGGTGIVKELKSKDRQLSSGCQPTTRRRTSGKTDAEPKPGPYVVPHVTRQFIIAADRDRKSVV